MAVEARRLDLRLRFTGSQPLHVAKVLLDLRQGFGLPESLEHFGDNYAAGQDIGFFANQSGQRLGLRAWMAVEEIDPRRADEFYQARGGVEGVAGAFGAWVC